MDPSRAKLTRREFLQGSTLGAGALVMAQVACQRPEQARRAGALVSQRTKRASIKAKYGPESIAFFGHTSGDFWFTDYLAQAWGSVNSAKPAVSMCTSPREEAALVTFGRSIGNHEPVDWENTQCVVLIGTHIGEDARNTMIQDLASARARRAAHRR